MKRRIVRLLSLSVLASMVLSGCTIFDNLYPVDSGSESSEPEPEPTPKEPDEIDAKTKKSVSVHFYSGASLKAIPVYFTKQTVDIPYAAFGTLYNNMFCGLYSSYTLTKKSLGDGIYRFENDLGYFEVNCEEDTVFVHNPANVLCPTNKYNGTSILATGVETNFISINSKTSSLEQPQDLSYNLKDYDLDIIEHNKNAFLPLMTLVDLLITSNGYAFAYNGKDLYCSSFFSYDASLETSFLEDSPWYEEDERSETLAQYTYNELCFNIDHFYGLKEDRGFEKIDDVITEGGWKDGLLSTDTETYEVAMQRFVGKYYSDGHSGYLGNSPFQHDMGYSEYYIAQRENTRESNLNAAIWENYQRRNAAGKGVGISFYSNTAIVTFDSFNKAEGTAGINVDSYSYQTLNNACSYLFFKKAFKDIKARGGITKVVFDVTCNGGGAADSLPWLEAFMSDDPFFLHKNTITGEISDVHYTVDLNQDGIIDENDTYKGQYDFYILTSNYSFSCANAFATVAKAGKMAKIIGQQSGGGACCVGEFVTASGTRIRNSSVLQLGTYNDKWTSNDAGVPVDYELAPQDFYNDQAIYNLVNAH